MPRAHSVRVVLEVLCTQVLLVSHASVWAQSTVPTLVPPTPPPRITLPVPESTIDTVGEYHAWLSEIPLRTGDVWIVEGDAYAPSDDRYAVAELCARPGSTIGAADRVFL